MGKSIHPSIKHYLESMLPSDQAFTARSLVLFNRRFHPLVCSLASAIHFIGPEIVRVRTSEEKDSKIYPIDSVISQVVLLAVTVKDFGFLRQLTTALERISEFDALLDKTSEIQSDLISACEDVIRQRKKLSFQTVWDALMEEPFNWYKKFNGRGVENVRGSLFLFGPVEVKGLGIA